MDNSHYDPDSAHSDSHVLVPFTKHLTGKRFAVVANVKQAVTSLLQKLDRLIRWDTNLGAAVEKMITTLTVTIWRSDMLIYYPFAIYRSTLKSE
jgi:hypothetical protein